MVLLSRVEQRERLLHKRTPEKVDNFHGVVQEIVQRVHTRRVEALLVHVAGDWGVVRVNRTYSMTIVRVIMEPNGMNENLDDKSCPE